MLAEVPQVPSFPIDGEWISISPSDGERLVEALRSRAQKGADYPDYEKAAMRIEQAMELGKDARRAVAQELRVGRTVHWTNQPTLLADPLRLD